MKNKKNVKGAKGHSKKNGTTLSFGAFFHNGAANLSRRCPPYNLVPFSP